MGAALCEHRARRRAPARRAAVQRRGGRARQPSSWSRRTRELSERASAGSDAFEFVGNVEGGDVLAGVADVVVTDGFTGNVALKLIEGVSQTIAARDPRRGDVLAARQARRRCCCAPRCAGSARRSIPSGRAAPTCSGCAGSASSRTGASRARASRGDRACASAARARTSSAGPSARWQARARCASRPCPRRALAWRRLNERTELAPDEHVRLPAHARARLPSRGSCERAHARAGVRPDPGRISPTSSTSRPRAIGVDTRFRRTSRPTRSTSTRSCRSSRTPTA